MRINGTVKFFNGGKGFGFIAPDDGSKDVFVHITALEAAGIRALNEGDKVSFVLEDDRRGREVVYGRFYSGGQWSGETRLGAVFARTQAARRPEVEAAGKDSFYVVWEVWDYSDGSTPSRSRRDDTVVVPR